MRFSLLGGPACILLAAVAMTGADAPKASEAGEALLIEQVERYEKTRDRLARRLPKIGDEAEPEEIARHKLELRRLVIAHRADAAPGDILSTDVFGLVTAVRGETAGPEDRDARDAVLHDGNPAEEGESFTPRVNRPYPPEAPRSTVPPALLARLPELPEGLEFRFVGRTLILYDAEIDLIVDYLSGVVKGDMPQ